MSENNFWEVVNSLVDLGEAYSKEAGMEERAQRYFERAAEILDHNNLSVEAEALRRRGRLVFEAEKTRSWSRFGCRKSDISLWYVVRYPFDGSSSSSDS